MNEKLLTVVVPAYNMHWCLEKNLRTYADIRFCGKLSVIVLDNSSDDDTFEIAQKFERAYPDIFTCVKKENKGYGSSVNAGIAMALNNSEYVRIIDADDWADTDMLDSFLCHLANCTADIVQTPYTKVDFATGCRMQVNISGSDGEEFSVLQLSELGILPCLHSSTFRCALLAEHPFQLQENTFYVDEELAVLALFYAKDICVFRDNVYQYLVNNASQSVSAENMVKYLSHRERVVVRLMNEYEAAVLPEANERVCFNRIALSVGNHYTTLYMLCPDRAAGRRLADRYTQMLKTLHPRFYRSVKQKRKILFLLNMLGVTPMAYEKLKRFVFGKC